MPRVLRSETNFSNLLCHMFWFLINSFRMCLHNLVICWHWEVVIFLLLYHYNNNIQKVYHWSKVIHLCVFSLAMSRQFCSFHCKKPHFDKEAFGNPSELKFIKCMFLTLHVAFEPKIAQWIIEENTATMIPKFAMVVFPSFMTSLFF